MGRDNEREAIKVFHVTEAVQHQNAKLFDCGLLVAKNGYIGVSLDGVMTCACHGKYAIEVKCPINLNNDTVNTKSSADRCEFLIWD